MERFIKLLRGDEVVSDAQVNQAFSLLVPIIERTPQAADAVEAARTLIGRRPPSDDSPLASVLDWWFVVTTGEPSANSGAHRLPETLDATVRLPMQAILHLVDNHLVGDWPAAEWLEKRRSFEACKNAIADTVELEHYGAVKLPGEREAWNWLRGHLDPVADDLMANRQAQRAEVDHRAFEKKLREGDIERNSRRWNEMVKRFNEATRAINQAVVLQRQVEPWRERHVPDPLAEFPDDLSLAIGPLARALLRPLLEHQLAASVNETDVARRLSEAASGTDEKGRYHLARIASVWCEESGQEIPALRAILERHRLLASNLESLRARSDTDLSEIELHVLDDDIAAAEEALQALNAQIKRQERLRRTRGQYEALRQALEDAQEAGLADTPVLYSDLQDFERRLDADESDLPREIGAAQQRLTEQLDAMLRERLDELGQRVNLLGEFGVADSVLSQWRERIRELGQRRGARGANELHRELEAQIEDHRRRMRSEVHHRLDEIDRMLDAASEFSEPDLGRLANQHSEIESQIGEDQPDDADLIDAWHRVSTLRSDVDERRIKRWSASDDGEERLLEHVIEYCTGSLDFDETDIRRLHVAVKTKPFVILAGLTGSGKSSLTRLYASAIGATAANGGFRRVAVRPDWIDQSEVLGFVNPVSGCFVPGWLAEAIQSCERQRDRLHFVLLDEMNLAPVEQYLAELLSAMEESRSGSHEVSMRLYPRGEQPTNADEWPFELRFPANLVIVGTVNVDETTRPLSERVIDRANVLHLNVNVSRGHHNQNGNQHAPWIVEYSQWCEICVDKPSDDHHDFLVDIADVLRRAGIGVGFRAHVELERFIANAEHVIDSESALDWGIVQRIIPKIRGFKGPMTAALESLVREFDSVGASESTRIVRRWLSDSVSEDEYLDGTDPKLTLARVWEHDVGEHY